MCTFVFRVPQWRFSAALTSGLTTGLNAMVFAYGPLSQAYGILDFRHCGGVSVRRDCRRYKGPVRAGAAGFFAGMAAASSLLSAAAGPVFLIWMLVCNRAGSRRRNSPRLIRPEPPCPLFPCSGCLAGAAPDLVQRHSIPRLLSQAVLAADDAARSGETLTAWIDSGQSLVLGNCRPLPGCSRRSDRAGHARCEWNSICAPGWLWQRPRK